MSPAGLVGAILIVVLAILAVPFLAGPARGEVDLYHLYERLQPGMTVEEVTATAEGGLRGRSEQSSLRGSCGILSAPAMAVLRAAFRGGRFVRLQYEGFGDEYQRLTKDTDASPVEMSREEPNLLGRRTRHLERAADDCQAALKADHRLVLAAQDRLTTAEQASGVRALELRREIERYLRRELPR